MAVEPRYRSKSTSIEWPISAATIAGARPEFTRSEAHLDASSDVIDSVTVLCLPENVPAEIRTDASGSPIVIVTRNDGAFNYEFVELLNWIDATVASMPVSARQLFSTL